MTAFYSRQPNCARRVCKQANAGAFNFTSQNTPSIYAVAFTKRVKPDAAIFGARCSRTVVGYRLDRVQALPLSQAKVIRLANGSSKLVRSPARWSSDVREPSGKKSGEMSRVRSAQLPGNGRSVAAAMPPSVRQDGSQDNLRHAGVGRAMSAPASCETTRNLAAQRSRNSRDAVHATASATSRKRLVRFSPPAFDHHTQKL